MAETTPQDAAPLSESEIVAARRAKLKRFRDELGFEPYGQRVDGLLPLADARALFSEEAHAAHEAAAKLAKDAKAAGAAAPQEVPDARPVAKVAGRIVQHRDMGKLVFLFLRDAT
ncbi:MAG: Lysine--tRNA ligase, partial [Verrucomicrobiota bacterium]